MPINLKYGQQAVARGFLTPQRLQQVLTKQRQLGEQGKKVSIRMILEKSKLLTPEQLGQIDRDLNIKVVKKQTGKIDRAAPPARGRPASTGAQNFAGEDVPQFSGMTGADPDATVFEPPPPDMQQRIKAERDKAKNVQRAKQEAEAASFFQQNEASPFGNDPFAGGDMAPEPFGGEMQPEPFGGEMQPEPFGGELQPSAGGFANDDGFAPDPFANDGAPQELDRMDSSPKLESLAAEHAGFASPDDEELPTLNAGFDDNSDRGFNPPPQRGPARAPQYAPQPQYQPEPAHGDLAPAGGNDFDSFGNDIMSPDELESRPVGPQSGTQPLGSGADIDRTMFSPPPPGMSSPRQKTGAMDRTVFSPRPPEFGGPQPMAEPEPAGDDWGEAEVAPVADFAEEPAGGMDATLFSPPPAELPQRSQPAQSASKKPVGRQGADDFADIELPAGKRMDDVPTSPSKGDEPHPLRRGTTASQPKPPTGPRKASRPVPAQEDFVSDDLPSEEPVGVPDIPDEEPAEEAMPAAKPGKPAKPELPKKKLDKKSVPQTVPPEDSVDQPKKKSSRVLLIFTLLLLVLLAVLIVPLEFGEQVPELKTLRNNEYAKPYYDYVEKVYIDAKKLVGLDSGTSKPAAQAGNAPANVPGTNAPTDNGPATNG